MIALELSRCLTSLLALGVGRLQFCQVPNPVLYDFTVIKLSGLTLPQKQRTQSRHRAVNMNTENSLSLRR